MLIHVHYPDNRFDYVKDHMLHGMIESGEIARFKRSTGWVTVGVDPIRTAKREHNSRRYPFELETVHHMLEHS